MLAAGVLLVVASGRPGGYPRRAAGLGTNGYGPHSPAHYPLPAVLLVEVLLTFLLVFTVLAATDRIAETGFAGLPIGLVLTLIHLVGIPVDNTSVNPARSLGVAWYAGGDALRQVWLFILAPTIGALIAATTYPVITGARRHGIRDEGVANNPPSEADPANHR